MLIMRVLITGIFRYFILYTSDVQGIVAIILSTSEARDIYQGEQEEQLSPAFGQDGQEVPFNVGPLTYMLNQNFPY